MADEGEVKRRVVAAVDDLAADLIALSRRLHANPEVAFQERQAAAWLTEMLERHGFTVERGVAGLPTAFIARYGRDRPAVAVLSEYDALPEVGHACGHNLIGPSAVAAGIALRAAADALGGTVMVYGTPAEELGGGKPVMVDQGLFKDVDAAMMFHPYPGEEKQAGCGGGSLALRAFDFTYRGKPAHSGFAPWEGRNALDAVILLFNAVNAMRQHVKPDVRIHGIITNGGQVFNIVPEEAACRLALRSFDTAYLLEVTERVEEAARGAALATGTELETRLFMKYDAIKPNPTLVRLISDNLRAMGFTVRDPRPTSASSDYGNVSQVLPSAGFSMATHPPGINFHTPEFAEGAATERALGGMLEAAKVMAAVGADLLADPGLVARAREEFAVS
ncbi:MAG: M20 family metallopeptidase [Armatimonadetes bacterium]|nr:M20 family metallopeptidase [Armatimonadota bacterium]